MRKKEPVERELTPSASKLYIIFSVIADRIAMPPFEFYKTTRIINENKIFIRDLSQCWYHDGLPGISWDIGSTAKFIKDDIQALNPEKVFLLATLWADSPQYSSLIWLRVARLLRLLRKTLFVVLSDCCIKIAAGGNKYLTLIGAALIKKRYLIYVIF